MSCLREIASIRSFSSAEGGSAEAGVPGSGSPTSSQNTASPSVAVTRSRACAVVFRNPCISSLGTLIKSPIATVPLQASRAKSGDLQRALHDVERLFFHMLMRRNTRRNERLQHAVMTARLLGG